MTNDEIWNCEREVRTFDIEVPAWIEQDITPYTIISICQGGCASGAYMPAVTYATAADTMREHGDDVLQYIEDIMGESPTMTSDDSWSGFQCKVLSIAVELWAGSVLSQLEQIDLEAEGE